MVVVERKRNSESVLTRNETKVVEENACLSTCHPGVACGRGIVCSTNSVGVCDVYSSVVR